MKKLSILLVMLLVLCLTGGALATVVNPGKSFEVDVDVKSKDAAFTILAYKYDKNAMEYQGTEIAGDTVKEGDDDIKGKAVFSATDGKISFARLGEAIDGIIGKLKFKAKEAAKPADYTVDFTVGDTFNEKEEKTTLTAQDQTITIETLINSFVRRCYSIILHRDPEGAGLQDWSTQLENGTKTAAEIVSGFINSPEFSGQGNSVEDTVEVLYMTMLNRASDAPGKADWVSNMGKGVSRNAIINGFCGSGEFMGLCEEYGIVPGATEKQYRDEKPDLTAFVSRCYSVALNRQGDEGGLNDWCKALLTNEHTPKEVAWGFVSSEEMTNRNLSNEELVDKLYELYLGRPADPAGKADWVGRLENGYSLQELADGFAGSNEFNEIVASYGLSN